MAALLVTYAVLFPWLAKLTGLEALLCLINISLAVVGFVRGWCPVARPIQTITFGFLLGWLGVAPIYQLATRQAAWGDDAVVSHQGDVIVALMLLCCATGALLMGFEVRRSNPGQNARVGTTRRYAPWVYLAACLALTPHAVTVTGGLAAMFSTRMRRAEAFASQGLTLEKVGGLQVAAVEILPGALALAATYLFLLRLLNQAKVRRALSRLSPGDACGLLIGLALVMLHSNPFIRTRFVAAGAAGALMLLVLRPRGARGGRWLALVTLLATLVVYPLANAFRTGSLELKSSARVFASFDFDGFQQIINAVSYVRAAGYSLGHYSLSALLYFVPRSMWSDKATPASIDVAEHRGYEFTNLSLPLSAELFIEFTAVGMLVIMVVIGLRLGRMDTKWLVAPQTRDALLVPYVAVAMLGVLRGPLGSIAPVYLTIIGLLWLGIRQSSSPLAQGPPRTSVSDHAERPSPPAVTSST